MRKVLDVPYIDQTARWPTGCESVSTVMALRYLGFSVTVDRFIDEFLETGPVEQDAEGRMTAPDPDECFVGSPRDPESFGCYPGVIIKAVNRCCDDCENRRPEGSGKEDGVQCDDGAASRPEETVRYRAVDATGMPIGRLLEEIDKGRPVIFWASIDLLPTVVGPSWFLTGGRGEFTWISNEHCMLLVGYDTERDTLVFNDPWHGHGVVDYDRDLVLRRHAEQKERAVILEKEEQ